jgi:hypothetical protein
VVPPVLLHELLTGTTPPERRRLREAAFDRIRRIMKGEKLGGRQACKAGARRDSWIFYRFSALMRNSQDAAAAPCFRKQPVKRSARLAS